jgi:NTE family protein
MSRIGLVLGAGGVVGHAWHAGTLAALAEATGWDPRTADLVVGTSAGSGVGATLRGGVSAPDLFARLVGGRLSAEGRQLFERVGAPVEISSPRSGAGGAGGTGGRLPQPSSPGYLLRSALLPWRTRPGLLLAAVLPEGRIATEAVGSRVRGFHDVPWPERPLWICAVRLDTGDRVVFGRDPSPNPDVATAVEASSAIPGFFRPVVVDGVRYVDGGAHSPTNADLVAGRHLDLVIVISSMSATRSALRGGPLPVLMARAMHSRALATEVAKVRRGGTPVVVFQPGTDELAAMGVNAMDFRRREPVARAAKASALRRLARADVKEALAAALPSP